VRVLSLNFRTALFSRETGEIPIFLLTITHPSMADPILLSTDPTTRLSTDPLTYGTVSRGITFQYAGVNVTLPDEQDKSPPASKLTVANVTQKLVPLARSVSTSPSVKIEAVLASALDSVELTFPAMDMTNLQYDVNNLVFDLTMDALATEPYPGLTMGPAYFPGLYL
jgi:hypothetical protein